MSVGAEKEDRLPEMKSGGVALAKRRTGVLE